MIGPSVSDFTPDDALAMDREVWWVRSRSNAPWHFVDCPDGPDRDAAADHRRLGDGPPPSEERHHYTCIFGPQANTVQREAARAAGRTPQETTP